MYHAKSLGRNNYQFYADYTQGATPERFTLRGDLQKALESEELTLFYQPQLAIDTKTVIGTEALIRWQHSDLGLVTPAEIIPLAEEIGLIEPISKWVLKTACLQHIGWKKTGIAPMRMAVNLSGLLFKQQKLVELVPQVLQDTSMDPSYLEIELGESSLLELAKSTIEALRVLKEMGVRIAVDDFGTGYSSLYHLKNYPLDVLKIDRSFIKDTPDDTDSASIVSAAIAMAHSLQLEVVAVGVETVKQLKFLREQGCDLMQGYLFSPPLPAYDIISLIQEEGLEMAF
jgi:EAL domain-containing protein (putative c-di-GMP-specific phosphodiesterase class I)